MITPESTGISQRKMKLICLCDKMPGRDSSFIDLTIGKIYYTIGIENIETQRDVQYCIIDDSNKPSWYSKYNFIEFDKWRDDQINKILD